MWLTPPYVLGPLGWFDLDPCAAPEPRPWPTACVHWGHEDDALNRPWFGRVWLNPPYGGPRVIGPWMRRMADHGRGTALIFARTETVLFHETVWACATGVLFLKGRLTFRRPDGSLPGSDRGSGNAGAPSCLIAYGPEDAAVLARCGLPGHLVRLARHLQE